MLTNTHIYLTVGGAVISAVFLWARLAFESVFLFPVALTVLYVTSYPLGSACLDVLLKRRQCLNTIFLLDILDLVDIIQNNWKQLDLFQGETKGKCEKHGASSMCVVEPVKKSSDPHDEVNVIVDYVVRDFFKSWYFCLSDYSECVSDAHIMLQQLARKFINKSSGVNLELLVKKIVLLYLSHLKAFQEAQRHYVQQPTFRKKGSITESSYKKIKSVPEAFVKLGKGHVALTNDRNEIVYLRALVEMIVRNMVPPDLYRCEPAREMVIEVLACDLLLPVIELMSQPDWLKDALIKVLSEDEVIMKCTLCDSRSPVSDFPSENTDLTEQTTDAGKSSSEATSGSKTSDFQCARSPTLPGLDECNMQRVPSEQESKVPLIRQSYNSQPSGSPEPEEKRESVYSYENSEDNGQVSYVCEALSQHFLLAGAKSSDIKPKPPKRLSHRRSFSDGQMDTFRKRPCTLDIESCFTSSISGDINNISEPTPRDSMTKLVDELEEHCRSPSIQNIVHADSPGMLTASSDGLYHKASDHMMFKPNLFDADTDIETSSLVSSLSDSSTGVIQDLSCDTQSANESVHSKTSDSRSANERVHSKSGDKQLANQSIYSNAEFSTGSSYVEICEHHPVNTESAQADAESPVIISDNAFEGTGPQFLFVDVAVVDTEVRPEPGGNGRFVLYVIQYQAWHQLNDSRSWIIQEHSVSRRYREFVTLHERLEDHPHFRKHMKGIKGPKKWLTLPFGTLDPKVVDSRRTFLQGYLQSLTKKEVICNSLALREFLAYEGDSRIAFVKQALEVPRIDKAIVKGVTTVFNKITNILPNITEGNMDDPVRGRSVKKRKIQPALDVSNWTDVDAVNMDFEEPSQNCPSQAEKVLLALNDTVYTNKEAEFQDPSSESTVSEFHDAVDFTFARVFPRTAGDGCEQTDTHEEAADMSQMAPLASVVLDLAVQSANNRRSWVTQDKAIHVFQVMLGQPLQEFLTRQMSLLTTRERCGYYLKLLHETLWPQGHLDDTPRKELTFDQKDKLHKECRQVLIDFFPVLLPPMVGQEDFEHCVDQILGSVKHEEINRHFLYCLIDLMAETLLPEINTTNIQRELLVNT